MLLRDLDNEAYEYLPLDSHPVEFNCVRSMIPGSR
jgi:hypothetical protein